ncbi:Pantothenate synthetase [Thalassovita gelatinovora]|uniref:Pantothenate synthetase n=1 Tax=Thalassovita gelatinovora TaxID=53501 RepID=A0A0P1F728_THAGE|nr:pantoate--beta-alanine ligase [Thalassovita gelatinovora]QIZ79184.1 pantoate--beta-alanine ligase [Thalassovita gelatinovora]CUH63661.1 Pantothenate synthetase [Thalassovita gelatinovora]SER01129.1 pantothenate synthetase [Thalassovita gelatinovora]
MKICRSIKDCRVAVADLRRQDRSIGFVPTMGALHDGHLSLVRLAQANATSSVVSIFVNPTQFGDAADLDLYPRDEDRDLALLHKAGVDIVFLPDADTIYPPGDETIVETTRLANMLHGKVRPGHFRGVTSVVNRLFNIAQPDVAVFGEKDYQQLMVIRQMVHDLHMPVGIIGGPTRREADGLAMSSRNQRLSPADRLAAVVLNRSLDLAEARACSTGATVDDIRNVIIDTIAAEPRAKLCGLDTVTADGLNSLHGVIIEPLAIMISVQFSDILLIDQRVIQP